MVAVADTKDGIAAVCNLAKRPRSIYLLYYLPPKNYGRRPKGGGLWRTSPPPKYATVHAPPFYQPSSTPLGCAARTLAPPAPAGAVAVPLDDVLLEV